MRIKCEITDPLFEWNAIQLKTVDRLWQFYSNFKSLVDCKTVESQISENCGLRIKFLLSCQVLNSIFHNKSFHCGHSNVCTKPLITVENENSKILEISTIFASL